VAFGIVDSTEFKARHAATREASEARTPGE
jgi:hypothetical protein